jgi:cephalosporin hydroxylase
MNLITIIKKSIPKSLFEPGKRIFHFFSDKKIYTNFNVRTIYMGHQKTTYRGIKAIKCPFDYVIYQMIISELKPDLVIEIGTHSGGGALYLADLLTVIGNGVVHTIDIAPISDNLPASHPRIKFFTKGWEGYDLKETEGFCKILVIEDGAHTYEHSIGAIKKFSPLVSVGSYLIVEDGILDELGMKKSYNGGPVRAIEEFLKINKDFVIDRERCDFFGKNATFNVNGYLKRIK